MEFSDPKKLINLDLGRKLTKEEICHLIRLSIAAEHDAVALYRWIRDNCDFHIVQKVMESVASEECVHIAEFMRVLFELDDKEHELYKKGFHEVEEIIKKG